QTTERRCRLPALDAFWPLVFYAFPVDEPGGDGVDPDTPPAPFQAGGAGMHLEGGLRHRVVAVGEGGLRGFDRGDVGDPSSVGHGGSRLAAEAMDRGQVGVD